MKLSIKDLENNIIVANHIGKTDTFSAKICNEDRDISIFVSYCPDNKPDEDIYPFWKIEMNEEEFMKTIYLNGNDLKEVRDIYNGFCNQGKDESFIENYIANGFYFSFPIN